MRRSTDTEIISAVAGNPACTEELLWELIDAHREASSALAERVLADAEAGRAAELHRRMVEDHRQVPHWITTSLGEQGSCEALSELLATPGGLRLHAHLQQREDFWDHPEWFALWAPEASGGTLEKVLLDDRCTVERIGDAGVEAITSRLERSVEEERGPHLHLSDLKGAVRSWVLEHGRGLVRTRAGVRLLVTMYRIDGDGVSGRWVPALLDSADLGLVVDDVLAEYPAKAVFAGELLRRRGVTDPTSWRFLLASGDHPGNAGTLAELAAATAHGPA